MTLSERADFTKELRGLEKCSKCEALRADLEAVAVALKACMAAAWYHPGDTNVDADVETDMAYNLGEEALARPGVQAVLERVKDG